MKLLIGLNVAISIWVAVYGFNALILTFLFLRFSKRQQYTPDTLETWPSVVVQVPVYNERYVIERVIDAVVALDYPADCLTIQILDDSDDDTTAIAQTLIDIHRANDINIQLVRREDRNGYKAGGLDYGLTLTDAEFVAIFDADSLPQSDFLRRVIPHMVDDPALGIVQTRWSFINDNYDPLTKIQALALDAHFVVEQTARQRSGLLMHFNGTAGVLRRACIDESGGWEFDTISEDMDISFRAQLAGWRCLHLPGVDVPTELPPTIAAVKVQQRRWSTGTIQCMQKLGGRLLKSDLTIWQKLQAFIQLSGYFVQPLMLIILLLSIPLLLTESTSNLTLAPLTLAALGPPVMITVSQLSSSPKRLGRLLYFPLLVFLGFGIAVNNTWGVVEGFFGAQVAFKRTPKFNLMSESDEWVPVSYHSPIDTSTWLEFILAIYAIGALILAINQNSGMVIFLGVYALGFCYVAGVNIWQSLRQRVARKDTALHVKLDYIITNLFSR